VSLLVEDASVFSIGQLASAEVPARELRSISTPDSVETPIGTLKFFDGVPTDDTVKKVYDNLDRMRGCAGIPQHAGLCLHVPVASR
jgi:hypothetical protein